MADADDVTRISVETDQGLHVTGDLHLDARTECSTGARCDGNAVLAEGARVRGDLVAGGRVTLAPGARVDGALTAGDGVVCHPRASVGGLESHGPLHVNGRVVAGAVEAPGGVVTRRSPSAEVPP